MVRIGTLREFVAGFAAAVALGVGIAPAQAASCGISGTATATPAVFDPFNPTGFTSTTIVLDLTRVNNSGGGDTRYVAFYLKSPQVGADGTEIIPTAISGSVSQPFSAPSLGLNIFHNSTGPFPIITPADNVVASSSNRIMKIDFNGNNVGSNTAQVTFTVNLPAGTDLRAIHQLAFDAVFGCIVKGGKDNNVEQTGEIANAVVFPINVLSALRTYYAGTALDFGEIGAITTASLSGTPVRTGGALTNNYIAVQSSGAYNVQVTSANNYLLKKPGAATVDDQVNYQLDFLGQTRSPSNTTPISVSCQPATMSGEQLWIEGTLLEGGQGKNPSPTYNDQLTVTVTPLIYSDPGINDCGGFTVP